jgi:carbonic anhydrase/acetyltransferase-like protein (isoleucine patch superfamily)
MHTTNHAKFGNGIIKEGESEDVRVWIDLMNETGCRSVLPFEGMIPADAYIWAKYRDDKALQEKLIEVTQNTFDSSRGFYGTIGNQCVIKNSRILKDVKIGSHCYIKGINKLKNLTIHSSETEQTQIGEGVELVNGIIGFGCHIFYGCKAVRFILGDNSSLKYGARLINSFLGDNSTISCCEVLNNLIFPAHEQHHNNSFLISSVVMGQSNLAAGATIGSNHNSRANDNEIQAGRGFWPGLCVSIKHSCRFASFVLLAKADYPAELDIPLPFSLLNNNEAKGRLEILPAFWWLHNMYAIARNSWKIKKRDNRERKIQNIEFDALAPDTVEEIFNARRLLEIWTAKASLRDIDGLSDIKDEDKLADIGRELLSGSEEEVDALEILGENMEKSKRKVVILKVYKAYHAYYEMLHYYAVKILLAYMNSKQKANLSSMCKQLEGKREDKWVNIGGQLIAETDLDRLRLDIGESRLDNWEDIHLRYDDLWERYPLDKQKHAFATLLEILRTDKLTKEQWLSELNRAVEIQEIVNERVYISRKKDFDNRFRQNTYRNMAEMTAAIGTIEDNDFVKLIREETEDFKKLVAEVKKREL